MSIQNQSIMASGKLIAMQNLRFVLVEGEAENEGDGLCHGNSAEKSHWTLAKNNLVW